MEAHKEAVEGDDDALENLGRRAPFSRTPWRERAAEVVEVRVAHRELVAEELQQQERLWLGIVEVGRGDRLDQQFDPSLYCVDGELGHGLLGLCVIGIGDCSLARTLGGLLGVGTACLALGHVVNENECVFGAQPEKAPVSR